MNSYLAKAKVTEQVKFDTSLQARIQITLNEEWNEQILGLQGGEMVTHIHTHKELWYKM